MPKAILRSLFVSIFFGVLFVALVYTILNWGSRPTPSKENVVVNVLPSKTIAPFAAPTIEAQTAVVWDVKNQQVLFEKNATQTRALASLTKVMTALTASRLLSATSTITITPEAISAEGDSGLQINEKWKLADLSNFMLMGSSNDAATAISLAVPNFIEEMNTTAKDLGLTSLKFSNSTGLDVDPVTSGGYGSAKDMALLTDHVLKNKPNLLEATLRTNGTFTSENGNKHFVSNTNTFVGKIPGILASKTGFTDQAQGNLVVAFDQGITHPVVIVVLGSSMQGRFSDTVLLASSTRAYLNQ